MDALAFVVEVEAPVVAEVAVRAQERRLHGLTRTYAVVGTGVDPVTSRFSGARSAN